MACIVWKGLVVAQYACQVLIKIHCIFAVKARYQANDLTPRVYGVKQPIKIQVKLLVCWANLDQLNEIELLFLMTTVVSQVQLCSLQKVYCASNSSADFSRLKIVNDIGCTQSSTLKCLALVLRGMVFSQFDWFE